MTRDVVLTKKVWEGERI